MDIAAYAVEAEVEATVEGLGEHRRRKEGDRPQGLLAGIGEIVPDRRRKDKNAARPDRMFAAPSSSRSSPVPERMYCVSSVASVCQPSRPPGSIS
ncbi:MAG: hypothetical protein ACXWVA_08390 [Rhodoplanes sp.]